MSIEFISIDTPFGKIQFRTWDEYNISEDAKVDKFDLDNEAAKQGEYMDKWLGVMYQAQRQLTLKEEVFDNVKARLTLDVKKNGIEGITKITEATADAWMTLHPEYIAALKEKNDAESAAKYLQNAIKILDHRKESIRVLDDLWSKGYYARPSVSPESVKQSQDNVAEVVKTELGASLRKRRTLN